MSAASPGGLDGRVCVITGATRGIGRATAVGLARLGATVALIARDAARGARACDEIARASGGARPDLVLADLASLASVRAAAAAIAARYDAVHALLHVAGVHVRQRTLSADGIELTLAVNHVAPFVLTHALMSPLRAGAPSRVITVTSRFERLGRIDRGDLQHVRHYRGVVAYCQSKLANLLFTRALAARVRDVGITANAVDPGLVATDLMREYAWWRAPWLRPVWRRAFLTPEAGARGVLYVAAAPELATVSGVCFDRHGEPRRTSRRSRDGDTAEWLWRETERLAGMRPAAWFGAAP